LVLSRAVASKFDVFSRPVCTLQSLKVLLGAVIARISIISFSYRKQSEGELVCGVEMNSSLQTGAHLKRPFIYKPELVRKLPHPNSIPAPKVHPSMESSPKQQLVSRVLLFIPLRNLLRKSREADRVCGFPQLRADLVSMTQ
jgi:hypothetical protein